MIFYVENLKEWTKKKKKCLELISIYNKVAGYKVNTQKSIAFLYVSNEQVLNLKLKSQYHLYFGKP